MKCYYCKLNLCNDLNYCYYCGNKIKKLYIYTTAISDYNLRLFDENEKYKKILTCVFNNIPKEYLIYIYHYSPIESINDKTDADYSELTKYVDTNIIGKDRLIYTKYNNSLFPKDLNPPINNIIIDMAHLISYAMNDTSYSYEGYNKDFLKDFNYIYLTYDIFNNFHNYYTDSCNLKLFEINDDQIITIHDILNKKSILDKYGDAYSTKTIWEILNILITKYNKANNITEPHKFGDEYSLKEKIDFLWNYKN